MKKLFFIACFISYANGATSLLSSQAESSVEQLIRIMISNTKDQIPASILTKNRNPNDYQTVYNLAIKYPKLREGIIHDGRTFAMLCVERGYADVLERLLNEDYLVDLATPCNLYLNELPQATVLHRLFSEVWKLRAFQSGYSEDYIARITGLTRLIINKYPYLLDVPVNAARTIRQEVRWENILRDLIRSDLPQSPSKSNDNSVK